MSANTGKTCPSCGSDIQIIYYQRRAADEPPDKVEYCPKCPLDTTRLTLPPSIPQYSDYGVEDISDVRTNESVPIEGRLLETRYRLRVGGRAALRCKNILEDSQVTLTRVISYPQQVRTVDGIVLCDVYSNSILEGENHALISRRTIAPFVELQEVGIYTIDREFAENAMVSGYETSLDKFIYLHTAIFSISPRKTSPHIDIYIEYDTNYKENVLNALRTILSEYGTETTIKSFASPYIVSSMYTQSARAYDWPEAPQTGYMYTWKPDGERFWCVKYGSVWLFCRRLLSGSISSWIVDDKLSFGDKVGPVLDVEMMIGMEPILIDVLVTETGEPTSSTRSLRNVLDMYYDMDITIPIYVRKYYNKVGDLRKEEDKLTYPVDGIVGIEDGSMTIIKLKSTKSIELSLSEDGSLCSEEGVKILSSDFHNIYEPSSIIELRITKTIDSPYPSVDEVILRTDKTKANSYEVCRTILRTMNNAPDEFERRKALEWCNSIRNFVHKVASSNSNRGRVIVDIGSGDGQAVSDYSTDPGVSYLLIEPDKRKCDSLYRRLFAKGKVKKYEGAGHFAHTLASLTSGSIRYGILCCKLSEVLEQESSRRMLINCVRCCIASFSLSYVFKDLMELSRINLTVIGCGYFYDGVDIGCNLVNKSGVVMKRESTDECSVKWGSDRVYNEPLLISDMLDTSLLTVHRASDYIDVPRTTTDSLLFQVSNSVYIATTLRSI